MEKDGEMEKGNAPLIFYGEYKNVRLSDDEYQKVQDKLHNHTDTMIENYQDISRVQEKIIKTIM